MDAEAAEEERRLRFAVLPPIETRPCPPGFYCPPGSIASLDANGNLVVESARQCTIPGIVCAEGTSIPRARLDPSIGRHALEQTSTTRAKHRR